MSKTNEFARTRPSGREMSETLMGWIMFRNDEKGVHVLLRYSWYILIYLYILPYELPTFIQLVIIFSDSTFNSVLALYLLLDTRLLYLQTDGIASSPWSPQTLLLLLIFIVTPVTVSFLLVQLTWCLPT